MAAKIGRPTKLNPTIQGLLCDAIVKGLPFNHACSLVGISYQTMREWMKKGKNQLEGLYRDFYVAIKKSEALVVQNALESIHSASRAGTWTASAWLLERRYPEQFGRKRLQSEEVTPIEISITGLPRPPKEG